MDWKTVEEAGLPPVGERVFVETKEGSWLYATRQLHFGVHIPQAGDGTALHNIDDSGCIIWSPIVRWVEVVSLDATP